MRAHSHVHRGSLPCDILKGVSESSHTERKCQAGAMCLGASALNPLTPPAGDRLHTYCVSLSLAPADATACTFTWMHARNAYESQHQCMFSFIHQSSSALPRDRKLCVTSLISNVFLVLYWTPLGRYQYVLNRLPACSITREVCTN